MQRIAMSAHNLDVFFSTVGYNYAWLKLAIIVLVGSNKIELNLIEVIANCKLGIPVFVLICLSFRVIILLSQ